MTIKYTVNITAEEVKIAREAIKPYAAFANAHPELTSVLYDIDLLPEQIRMVANANRLIVICTLWQQAKGLPEIVTSE